jgi:hypothetical protein
VTARPGRRSAVVVLVGIVCLLVAGLQTADAARLRLATTTKPAVALQSRCGTGPVTVRPTGAATAGRYTQVRVAGVDGPCRGGRVVVYTTSGVVALDGSGTLSAGAFTASTTTAFTPPGASTGRAYVTLDGWPVAATWNPAPVSVPVVTCRVLHPTAGQTCAAVVTSVVSWGYPSATEYNAYVQVSSTSPATDVEWEVTVNLADAALPFVARSMTHNNQSQLGPGWTCAQLPALVLTGQATSSSALVGGGRVVDVYLNGRATAGSGSLYSCP